MVRIVLTFFAFFLLSSFSHANYQVATIYSVGLYENPSFSSSVLEQIGKGVELTVISEIDEWLKVRSPSGEIGHVAKKWITTSVEELRKKRKDEIDKLIEKLKTIPANDYKANLEGYSKLCSLDPANENFSGKRNFYQKKLNEKKAADRAGSVLEILNWSWTKDEKYVEAVGQVKNISNDRLFNVQAVVGWFDKSDSLITYERSLVEFDPIMPGQTSPFKITARFNPMMDTAVLRFKQLGGSELPTYFEKK